MTRVKPGQDPGRPLADTSGRVSTGDLKRLKNVIDGLSMLDAGGGGGLVCTVLKAGAGLKTAQEP